MVRSVLSCCPSLAEALPILEQTGMQLRYVEAWDGHNWENWRDRLREGLSWLFPGAIWMIYE